MNKQQEVAENEDNFEDEFVDDETTTEEELQSFEKWAKGQAKVALNRHKDLSLEWFCSSALQNSSQDFFSLLYLNPKKVIIPINTLPADLFGVIGHFT